jgi:hypothetical protein
LQHRQGDLLFEKIDRIPKKAVKRNTDIILEGEATGHAHRLVNGELFRGPGLRWERDFDVFINAGSRTEIVHEEHGTIGLEPGKWKVTRQREHAMNGSRNILD